MWIRRKKDEIEKNMEVAEKNEKKQKNDATFGKKGILVFHR